MRAITKHSILAMKPTDMQVIALLVVAALSTVPSAGASASASVLQHQSEVTPEDSSTDDTTTIDKIPTWEELDSRPLPAWYDAAKFGIFIHWGVFSVPSFTSEWFWDYWHDNYNTDGSEARFVTRTERPGFAYQEYAPRFTADLYNATEWSNVFALSGAQYVVLTSKHHEGYCMWNSTSIPSTWNWNVMDVGPHRDVLGELAAAVKRTKSPHTSHNLKFGVYHSMYEWYNPLYLQDKASNFTTQHFVNLKTLAELYDLVERYGPELVWSDGEWEAPSDYWKSREFLHWYSTQSSVADTAVWNDRWGSDTLCKHGGFLTCFDRYMPDSVLAKKWEDCLTVDKNSWGYNRLSRLEDYMTVTELVHSLIEAASRNGNLLLNVGPASDGTIHPIFVDRLRGIGDWLVVNGEAIYSTTVWKVCQNETASSAFYTRTSDLLYVHVTRWPTNGLLQLDCPIATAQTEARMLGLPSSPKLSLVDVVGEPRVSESGAMSGLTVQLPSLTPDLIPCQHAWVVVLSGIANL